MFKKLTIFFLGTLLLTGCFGGKWNIDVDLTEDEKKWQEAKVAEFSLKIKNYEPNEEFTTPDPPLPYWLELARSYENLGKLGKALDTYEKASKIYSRSQAIENNMAKIYQKAGEYEKAVEKYQYLVESYQEDKYLRDITKIYIELKDRKTAEKYFNLWQLATQSTDAAIQSQLKKLREEEKAVEN